MRAGLARLTWKVLLYLVVAVLIGGLTRDRVLTALLTAGFVFGDRGVAAVLRATTATDARRRQRGEAGTRATPGQASGTISPLRALTRQRDPRHRRIPKRAAPP